MRFFKRLALKRYIAMLLQAKGDTFTAQESMNVLQVLDTVISTDGIIKYFDVRVSLSIMMDTQLPNAVAMLDLISEINRHIQKDMEATLPDHGLLFSEFRDLRKITLYDWLSDDEGKRIDAPLFYQLFIDQLNQLITVIVNCEDESTRQYYLRRLQPLYNELLETVRAALHCGMLSL